MNQINFDSHYLRRKAGNYPVECPDCGWTGLENERIFYCPSCGGSNVEEVDLPPILRPPTHELAPGRPQATRHHAALMLAVAAVVAAAWVVGRRR